MMSKADWASENNVPLAKYFRYHGLATFLDIYYSLS